MLLVMKRYERTPVSSYMDRREYLKWYYQLVVKKQKYEDCVFRKKEGNYVISFD